ncbi:MAG TPA: glycosyltransferase [Pyrinomonadaceae bacterium]|jgi:GT2 family glycosyltransferase
MKKRLQEKLPLPAKLLLKQLLVVTVGAGVKLVAGVYNFGARLLGFAAKHGLDLHAAWNVTRPPHTLAAPSHTTHFGARDFLFLTNALSGAQSARDARDRPAPRTSIVIPVFNQVEFTFQCLRSLLGEIDFDETEVIVVNYGSTDETAALLAHFQGLVNVIDNEAGGGFVGACNQGAATARGEHLVFLKPDAVVLPGWLTHLRETAEGDVSVGAVGSMFLSADGRVREAGAGVWRNGAAFHYGRGGSPDDRRYNFAREVDYCSGASLLVRRELFERLGGFDRRYAPASYEDVDLCFGLRALGCKVVYQPMSRVMRREDATAGRDDAVAGRERYQAINRAKFVEKWRAVLERENLPEDPARALEASNRKRAPLVIVFDERIPTPDRDAGSARMLFILKSLARSCRPVFVPLNRPHGIEYERLLWKEGIETANIVEYNRLLRERKFHAAVLSRPLVADGLINSLRGIDPSLRIVFDMVDTYFIRLERESLITGDESAAAEARRYREIELRLARASNLVWCASSEDKHTVARELPEARIEVIPTIHPLHGRGESFAAREHLLFLGNLAHRPNADAVHHFMRDIFPLVRGALPGVKLYVVGDNVTPEIAAYAEAAADVEVLGYVPDVEPLFRRCRLMVVPLRYGAGIKGKLGESLSYGLPVVTTSTGAEGFGLTGGVEALIADDPREFAAAVVRAYEREDLWERLAEHGHRHIEKYFTPEVIAGVVHASLRELGVTKAVTGAGESLAAPKRPAG